MVRGYLQSLGRCSRNVWLVVAANAVLGFSYVGIYAVLFNLYLLRLGYGTEFIGQVNATGRLGFALFGLPAGIFAHRLGIRRLLIAGEILMTLGLICLPLGELLPAPLHSLWLRITYLLAWGGAALYFVNLSPFLMAVTPPSERNHVFSAVAALGPLSAFTGSLVGGALPGLLARFLPVTCESSAPYQYSLVIAGALFILALPALLATRAVHGGEHAESDDRTRPAPVHLFAATALVVLLVHTGYGTALTFSNVYLDDGLHVPTHVVGILAAIGQLASVPAAAAMPGAVARWGHQRSYLLGGLAAGGSLVLVGLLPHWSFAGLGFVSMMACGALTGPIFTVYSQGIVRARWRPAMSGTAFMTSGLSWALAALFSGYIIAGFGYRVLFTLAGATTAAGAVVFALYYRVPRGRYAESEPLTGATDVVPEI